jgi:ABC-2 type transport system ATP-binding protein
MIRTSGLTRTFGSLTAVNDLNMIVSKGELFGFLGPNGAGKTTTIRMLVGLLRPSKGTAVIGGHDVQKQPLAVKRITGYLAQTPLLYDKLTGREFLRFAGGLHNLDEDEIESQTEMLLDLVDLEEKGDQLIESYSGGMRHKIGLCSALLHGPRLLVLDEPLAGLDPASARRVKDLLRDLCSRGTTVFLSTHVLEIAERVCDRVGILQAGTLLSVGTMAELREQAQSTAETTLEELFLQLTGGAELAPMAAMLE